MAAESEVIAAGALRLIEVEYEEYPGVRGSDPNPLIVSGGQAVVADAPIIAGRQERTVTGRREGPWDETRRAW